MVFYCHTELFFILNQLGFVWFLVERNEQGFFFHSKFVTVNFSDILLLQLLETYGSKCSVLGCTSFFVLALTRTQGESILSGGWPADSHLIVSAQHWVRHFEAPISWVLSTEASLVGRDWAKTLLIWMGHIFRVLLAISRRDPHWTDVW